MQNIIFFLFFALSGITPQPLKTKTFYSAQKQVPAERINSNDFAEDNYINSHSEEGFLWIETELPAGQTDASQVALFLGTEQLYRASAFVQDTDGVWHFCGETGDGIKTRHKPGAGRLHAILIESAKWRTPTHKALKVRLRIDSAEDSLVLPYLIPCPQFFLLQTLSDALLALFFGIFLMMTLAILFYCATFQEYKYLPLLFSTALLSMELFVQSGAVTTYLFPGIIKHKLYVKTSYFFLCGAVMLLSRTVLHIEKALRGTAEKPSTLAQVLVYLSLSVLSAGIILFILPVDFMVFKQAKLAALILTTIFLLVQTHLSIKNNSLSPKKIYMLWNASALLITAQEFCLYTRFLPGTSRVLRIFDNGTIPAVMIAFFAITVSAFLLMRQRIRERFAFIQINTEAINESNAEQKKRSYINATLVEMLNNPLQLFEDLYEKAKDALPAATSAVLKKNIRYTASLVSAMSVLSNYEHNENEARDNATPINLRQFLNESIAQELSSLRQNGCYPQIQEIYDEGTYVLADRNLLFISLKFLLQAIVNAALPRTTVFITSEYKNLTLIFTIQFECSPSTTEMTQNILNLSQGDLYTQPSSQILGNWGIQLHIVNRLLNMQKGYLTIMPSSGGASVQMRLALSPYAENSEFPIVYDTSDEELDLGAEEETCSPKYERTIILVEENSDVRALLQQKLGTLCTVHSLPSSNELVSSIEALHPELVVYSLSAPGKQLSDLLEERPELSAIPFIATAKYISQKTARQLYDYGVIEILQKPFVMETVLHKIDAILKNRQNHLSTILAAISESVKQSMTFCRQTDAPVLPIKNGIKSPEYAAEQDILAVFISAHLTKKEMDIAKLIATGKTDKEIATALNISAGTVAVHNKNIYKKLGIHSRHELIEKLHKQ